MWLIESFKKKKLILFNIFLTLYIGINLVGGERGLVSYFEKKTRLNSAILTKQIHDTDFGRAICHKAKAPS